MSVTIKSVVTRFSELVDAVDALLAGNSMDTITQLVAALGIGNLLLKGADLIERALRKGLVWVGELRESTSQTDALRGLVGLLTPILRGVEEISKAAVVGLGDMGLGALEPAVEPARSLGEVGQRVLKGADAALQQLPDAEQMKRLSEAVTSVIERIEKLRATVHHVVATGGDMAALKEGAA